MIDPVVRRGKSKRRLVFAGIVVLLVAFVWYRHSGHGAGGGGRHGMTPPQAVGVANTVSGSMPEVLDELGTVTPIATVTVVPQLSGYLTQVVFTQGEDVTQGEFLAEIDPRPYQIQLEQFQASLAKDTAALAQARSDLSRSSDRCQQTPECCSDRPRTRCARYPTDRRRAASGAARDGCGRRPGCTSAQASGRASKRARTSIRNVNS